MPLLYRRSSSRFGRDDVDVEDDYDDEDEVYEQEVRVEEDVRPRESLSLTKRVSKARSVRSLLRAVQRAAMRVNHADPDAFLSLLASRPGRAEQIVDEPDVLDQAVATNLSRDVLHQAVQTDQWPPPRVHAHALARPNRLHREMAILQGQKRFADLVTYVIALIVFISTLLFGRKLWASITHSRADSGSMGHGSAGQFGWVAWVISRFMLALDPVANYRNNTQ